MADLLSNAKKLYQGQLAASETTLATVPSSKKWIILHIMIANTDTAAAHTLGLSLVPNGDSAGNANRIVPTGKSINAGDTLSIGDLYLVMDTAGDFLSGIADVASKLTVTVSGCEV